MAQKLKYTFVEDVASGGVNTLDDPTQLATNESPYILNMNVDKKGRVVCRFGYEQWGEVAGGVTGGFRGLLPYYRTYGSNSGDYLLSFHSNGNAYSSTNAAPTPSSLGAYGTNGSSVRGIVFNNLAIFSNNTDAPSKWEGTGALAALGGSPADGNIWAQHNRFLLRAGNLAAPTTFYNSDVDDPEDWSTGVAGNTPVAVGDGQDVTFIDSHSDACTVYKTKSKHGAVVTFDADNVMVNFALKEIVDRSGGCVATGSAQNAINKTYYLSQHGFQAYGAQANYPDKRIAEALSYKIKTVVDRVNLSQADLIASSYFENRYKCAAPLNKSAVNNIIFVWNDIYSAWTLWNGVPAAAFAVFRDADKKDQEYFAAISEPKIFKFNKSFSDDGAGYTRIYRSRTWRHGIKTRWRYLDIYGSKVVGQDISLRVNVDGVWDTEQTITDDNFIISALGSGYVGDNYVGDSYVGGGSGGSGEVAMYNFHKRYDFGDTVNQGRDMFFELQNSSDGGGWSFNAYGVAYENLSENIAYESSYQ